MSHDPLHPHAHDPNPDPPSVDPTFQLRLPHGDELAVSVASLAELSQTTLTDCYIVSTGHGSSGPFTFTGPTLLACVQHYLAPTQAWSQVEVISADGFGTRVRAAELLDRGNPRPILLALTRNGQPLTRQQGLVRLIVPSETDDALRQVKWVGQINIRL